MIKMPAPALAKGEEKLAELILYISQKRANDPRFGAVKLNKILYFADFFAYGNWGRSITDSEYQHLPKGPAPRRLLPVKDVLVFQKALVEQPVHLKSGFVQRRTVNLREPNLQIFSGEEIALVDDVMRMLDDLDAEQVSELSHRMVGWKVTKDGETISYQSVFLSDAPLTLAEMKRGQDLAKELKLVV